jgi:hypothetical protein
LLLPLSLNGFGPELSQITLRAQLMAQAEHPIFPKNVCATGMMWYGRTIAPINLIQFTTLSSLYPSLHGRKTAVKLPGYRSHRGVTTNSFDHSLPTFLFGSFLPMLLTPKENVFIHNTDLRVLASR